MVRPAPVMHRAVRPTRRRRPRGLDSATFTPIASPGTPAGTDAEAPMLIRIGYEIVFDVPAPGPDAADPGASTPVRDAPTSGTRTASGSSREVPVEEFLDGFGNRCARIVAPAGPLAPPGRHGRRRTAARPTRSRPTPRSTRSRSCPPTSCVYLLASRYCEVDRLSDIAWDLFGQTRRGLGRGCRRSATGSTPRRVRLPVRPPDQDGLRRLRRSGRASAATSRTWPSPSAAA